MSIVTDSFGLDTANAHIFDTDVEKGLKDISKEE